MNRARLNMTLASESNPIGEFSSKVSSPHQSHGLGSVYGTTSPRRPRALSRGSVGQTRNVTSLTRARALSRGAISRTKDVTSRANMRGLSCPAELKNSEIAAGLRAEERADRLPLMGTAPPVHRGGQVNSRLTLPPSTIQTDLARHPAAIGLARVLQPAEDSLMQTQSKNDSEQIQTHAFIRLASENCRAIILALPDSGNLCRLDIISSATFKALNRCARQKLVLEAPATNSDIRGVTGDSLKILGQVKGGMKFHLQGTAGALHLQVLVSSNFTGQHLNLSQRTMARL